MIPKHLLLSFLTFIGFTNARSMEPKRTNTDNDPNVSIILRWAPENIWLHIIARCSTKNKLRRTCKYFQKIASTNNEDLFLQNPLTLTEQALKRFVLYHTDLGNSEIVRNLLANGADPNEHRYDKKQDMSLMHYAAQNGYSDIVNMLLECPNINTNNIAARYNNAKYPFCLALKNGHTTIAKRILSIGSTVNILDALSLAVEYENSTIIESILSTNSEPGFIQQALSLAASNGAINIARDLFKFNVNVNAPDHNGRYPLHHAVENQHIHMILFLLSKGARLDVMDAYDKTLFYSAICTNNPDIVQLLIDYGADINDHRPDDLSPLHSAVNAKNLDIVTLLVQNGADINATDVNNDTQLHFCLCFYDYRFIEIFNYLIEQPGIEVNAINDENKTPLDIAYKKNKVHAIEVLRQKGGKTKKELDGEPQCLIQ